MKKFGEIEVFDSIYVKLEQMEEQQKVDLSITGELDILRQRFRELEMFWVRNRRVKIDDAFVLYHCARNCENILEKMKNRFLEAHERHLNPQVVRDSSSVISSLHTLYDFLDIPSEESIDPEKINFILNRLKETREIASNVSMLPSFHEETKNLNILKLRKQFVNMAKSLQAKFFEE